MAVAIGSHHKQALSRSRADDLAKLNRKRSGATKEHTRVKKG